jgi:hypothetical protein
MTDRQRVYTKVLRSLKEILKSQKQGHVVTLAMMIAGIVMSKKAQLSVMSLEVPHPAKAESIEKRMHRFVKNHRIDVEAYYLPFAQALVHALANQPLVLAMDGSQVGRGCMVLMVGVIYKRRALPLAWIVYRGKKDHTTTARHIAVLELVRPLIPTDAEVILLGDGEYDSVGMLQWIEAHTHWHFVVRTAKSSLVRYGGHLFSLSDLPIEPDVCQVLENVGFTAQDYGPLLALACWELDYEDPIYLISNLEDAEMAMKYYKRRYRLETLFSDKKSRGFHIHKSHLSDPNRLSRLLLAACLAFIWMIYLGLSVVVTGQRTLIDRTHRQDKSLFRLGLDWLTHLLMWGKPIPLSFFLSSDLLFHESVR